MCLDLALRSLIPLVDDFAPDSPGCRPFRRHRGNPQGSVARLPARADGRWAGDAGSGQPIATLWRAADAHVAADRAGAQFPVGRPAADPGVDAGRAGAAALGNRARRRSDYLWPDCRAGA